MNKMKELLMDYESMDDVEFYNKYMAHLSGEEVLRFIRRFATLTAKK